MSADLTKRADTSSPHEDDHFDWSPKCRISLPQGVVDEYMLVPIRDFQRLRRHLNRDLAPKGDFLSAACFALFGAAVAVAAAVPPLMTSNGQPAWVSPIFISSAAVFLVLGLVLAFLARILKGRRDEMVSDLTEELSEIENTYVRWRLPK